MRRSPFAFSALAAPAALLFLGSCAALFLPDRNARAPVLDGFGSLETPVVSAVPAAQQLFARGLLQSYAFNDAEAARAFKAALALDPNCAMCAWGAAKADGPNINNPDRGDLTDARRYLAWAAAHVDPLREPRTRPDRSPQRALWSRSRHGQGGGAGDADLLVGRRREGASARHRLRGANARPGRRLPRRSRHPGAVCRGGADRDARRLVGQEDRRSPPARSASSPSGSSARSRRIPGTPGSTTS